MNRINILSWTSIRFLQTDCIHRKISDRSWQCSNKQRWPMKYWHLWYGTWSAVSRFFPFVRGNDSGLARCFEIYAVLDSFFDFQESLWCDHSHALSPRETYKEDEVIHLHAVRWANYSRTDCMSASWNWQVSEQMNHYFITIPCLGNRWKGCSNV